MFPAFLVEETTVRESGESPVFDCGEQKEQNLIVTLGITHAVERESIDVEILGSKDGVSWGEKAVLIFPPKYYCGTYPMWLASGVRYLKAVWRVSRWAGGDRRPYFRFYVLSEPAMAKAMAGAA
jgi:hypothetical protein